VNQPEFEFETWMAVNAIKPVSKTEKRPLTQDELTAIDCLSGVRFLPASFEKRFNRDVLQPAAETKMLSEKAIAQLWRLFIRYRRQWRHPEPGERSRLLRYAEEHAAPDFRKLAAAAKERAEIDKLKEKYGRALHS